MEELKVSNKSKAIKKSKFPVDIEAEKAFDGLKRKYANAIAFLLVKNVPRQDLYTYFSENDENIKRFQTIKKLRADVDKAMNVSLDSDSEQEMA